MSNIENDRAFASFVLESSKGVGVKQKAVHELEETLVVMVYLAFFFCALATYRMILLNDWGDWWFHYTAALINALVVGKVILIGEYAHIGKRYEAKPLLLSSIYKAFTYSLLVLVFHFVEEAIKRLIHGENVAGAFRGVPIDHVLSALLVVFCTFIPFFGFRELSRVLGEDKFRDLVFHRKSAA